MWNKIASLIIYALIFEGILEFVNAAEPETIAAISDPYYWNGHFIGQVGVASTYIPRVVAINQDDIVIFQQTFVLRVKLGRSWKTRWNHYDFPASTNHWISIEIIKPSKSTYVGVLTGTNGIFVIDSSSNSKGILKITKNSLKCR